MLKLPERRIRHWSISNWFWSKIPGNQTYNPEIWCIQIDLLKFQLKVASVIEEQNGNV